MAKTVIHRQGKLTLADFQNLVRGLSRDRLIAVKTQLVDERARVKAELRAISSTGTLKGEAREYAKNQCIAERDLLGAKIAHVINLLSKMKRLKKGLQPRRPTHA